MKKNITIKKVLFNSFITSCGFSIVMSYFSGFTTLFDMLIYFVLFFPIHFLGTYFVFKIQKIL